MGTVQRIKMEYLRMTGLTHSQRIFELANMFDERRVDIRECLRHLGLHTEMKGQQK